MDPLLNNGLWAVPSIAGPRAIYEASRALYTPGRAAAAKRGGVQFTPEMQGIIRAAAGSKPSPVFNAPSPGGGGVQFTPEMQGILGAAGAAMSPLFNRSGVGPKPPRQPEASTFSAAPSRVVPGQAIDPGPGYGRPEPVVASPAAARAEEANRAYQQAGGDISKNYWTANPEIAKAASDPNRLTSEDVGYENRADIQAWMNAQGRDSQIVKNFLAQREKRGLLAKPGDYSNASISPSTQQAVIEGFRSGRDQLVGTEPIASTPLPDRLSDGAMAASLEYYRGKGGPELAGSQGLSNAPNGPVDLRQAQAQASFAPGNQNSSDWNTFNPGVGNLHSSDQIRGMNLSGDQALGEARLNQALATRPDPDAKAAEPESAPAERPEDAFLNERMRKLMESGNAYSNGAISGIW